ncbi:MAG: DNA polymerase III subunit gamma/tau, partial [Clostridia bacterium]|nr:DNA polymerase III subunit gamma/tau [Clostridia bacterium]
MSFEKLYGHNKVKQQLEDILNSGTLSHAYIFSGPKGVGKYDFAKEWANMITDGHAADIKEVTNENYAPD